MVLLLAFILVPLAEIAVFIQVGERIGLWPTLATVILTALVGTALLRHQGLATLQRVQNEIERGGLPVGAVFDGACLLLAGALLLTPGFLTDAAGLLLFVPPFRALLGRALWTYLQRRGDVHVFTSGGPGGHSRGGTIDGEYRDVTPEEDREPRDADKTLPPRHRDGPTVRK